MKNCVLIVAAHPDDEILGCGGAIAKHVAEGDIVKVIFIADGVGARELSGVSEIKKRKVAANNARLTLGYSKAYHLDFPDNRLDSVALLDIVQPLECLIKRIQPQIVYTHHIGDLNIDHQITHRAVMTACRPQPGSTVRKILAFEVMSSTEWAPSTNNHFLPNYFIEITNYLRTKVEALQDYADEMKEAPHSRSIAHLESLAYHRGSTIGVSAAEAYMLIRCVS